MKRWLSVTAILLAVVLLSGCVPAKLFAGLRIETPAPTSAAPLPTAEAVPDRDDVPDVLLPFEAQSAKRADLAFSDMEFTAPDAQATSDTIRTFLEDFRGASSAAQQVEILREIDRLTSADADMAALAGVRFSMNATDKKAQADNSAAQAYNAEIMDAIFDLYSAILESPFADELETYFGSDTMDVFRRYVASYDSEIAALQVKIDAIKDEYIAFCAEHSGEAIPLSGTRQTFSEADMRGHLLLYGDDPEYEDINELVRDSLNGYYDEIYIKCSALFSSLIALRTEQALLAGYDNYPEYAIATSTGSYTAEDIKTLIRNVREKFVPVMESIRERGETALGEPMTAKNYYLTLCPALYVTRDPDMTEDEVLQAALDMVSSTGESAAELCEYMRRYELLQVKAASGKETGAYTTFFNGYKQPLIYSNGVDLATIVHEMGHALNYYLMPEPDMGERFSMGSEIAEVHSMGMEMLCIRFYPDYYGSEEGAQAAEAYTLFDALHTLLQQTMFSEFEMTLYERPNMSPNERRELYEKLTEEYGLAMPGDDCLNDGRIWVEVHHFYTAPAYVQDYTLAQTAALEIWDESRSDWDRAAEKYEAFLLDQQQLHFSRRLESAGLSDPFETETLDRLAQICDDYFASDDYTRHYDSGRIAWDAMFAEP